MFDKNAEIHVTARTASGKTSLLLRWPADEEWGERARLRKILIKRSGRGITETVIEPNTDADLKLYDAIKQNGAPPLSPAEASRVLDVLALCDVRDVKLFADDATVELGILGGEVEHRLKLPTAEQVLALRKKASKVRDLPYNTQELRILMEPGAKLWDTCEGQSDGYPGGVPALHKDIALRAVIDALDRELAQGVDEADF
jgi:hypothetical protein